MTLSHRLVEIANAVEAAVERGDSEALKCRARELKRMAVDVEHRRPGRRAHKAMSLVVSKLPARREKSFCAVVDDWETDESEAEDPVASPLRRFRALHPNSAFKRRWDFLTSIFALVLVFGPEARGALAGAVDRSKGLRLLLGEMVLEAADAVAPSLYSSFNAWFVADICLNFVTGYVDRSGVLVMQKRRIAVNYLTTCFVLDLWCALSNRAASTLLLDHGPVVDPCETALAYCPPPKRPPLVALATLWRRLKRVVPRTLAFARRRGRLRQVLVSAPSLTSYAMKAANALRVVLRLKWTNAAVLARRALQYVATKTPSRSRPRHRAAGHATNGSSARSPPRKPRFHKVFNRRRHVDKSPAPAALCSGSKT